jgi:hypothetical protein
MDRQSVVVPVCSGPPAIDSRQGDLCLFHAVSGNMATQLPRIAFGLCAAAVGFALLTSTTTDAHSLPISELTIVPDADYLHLELMLNPFELTFFPEIDTDRNGQITARELEAQQSRLTHAVLGCLKVRVSGQQLSPEVAGMNADPESHHLTLRAHYRVDARQTSVAVESTLNAITGGSHVTQVTFGKPPRVQWARLDMQTITATFGAPERPSVNDATQPHNAVGAEAVLLMVAIPGMIMLACIFIFIRRKLHEDEIAHSH